MKRDKDKLNKTKRVDKINVPNVLTCQKNSQNAQNACTTKKHIQLHREQRPYTHYKQDSHVHLRHNDSIIEREEEYVFISPHVRRLREGRKCGDEAHNGKGGEKHRTLHIRQLEFCIVWRSLPILITTPWLCCFLVRNCSSNIETSAQPAFDNCRNSVE